MCFESTIKVPTKCPSKENHKIVCPQKCLIERKLPDFIPIMKFIKRNPHNLMPIKTKQFHSTKRTVGAKNSVQLKCGFCVSVSSIFTLSPTTGTLPG